MFDVREEVCIICAGCGHPINYRGGIGDGPVYFSDVQGAEADALKGGAERFKGEWYHKSCHPHYHPDPMLFGWDKDLPALYDGDDTSLIIKNRRERAMWELGVRHDLVFWLKPDEYNKVVWEGYWGDGI